MEVFEGHRALLRPLAQPAIAIGSFDGVHLGHQALLARTQQAAADLGGDAVVYTFDPHPAQILAPDKAPPLLTRRPRQLELFADAGMDVAIVETFNREFASLSPKDFLDIFVDVFGARHIVVGYDFTFGADRAGTAETLREYGRTRNIHVDVVAPVTHGDEKVSSTRIRNALHAGELETVSRLLGRPFDIDGTVVCGAGRGRTIGFPTANMHAQAELLPPPGVYAVRARLLDQDQRDRPAVANLGYSPTFGPSQDLRLEVHLFDFEQDIVGAPMRVQFIDRLRNERKFPSVEELVAQIAKDADCAREKLGGSAQ